MSYSFRIGHGYDVHRLVEGRRLVMGGVEIPFKTGLLGHSDADVLVHAVCDALLGAAKLRDIGALFPDTDPQYENVDSIDKLLSRIVVLLKGLGYQIGNIDATIIAQAPKMSPYIDQMCRNIAKCCRIGEDCVSVKATTGEGLGFSGRGEGIAAHAVCLLYREGER